MDNNIHAIHVHSSGWILSDKEGQIYSYDYLVSSGLQATVNLLKSYDLKEGDFVKFGEKKRVIRGAYITQVEYEK